MSKSKSPVDENSRTIAVLFRRSKMERPSEQLDGIISAESDIISTVHRILDRGCDESAAYVISSTLNTVRKVNEELDKTLDGIGTRFSLTDVADCRRELEFQKRMIDRIAPMFERYGPSNDILICVTSTSPERSLCKDHFTCWTDECVNQMYWHMPPSDLN